MALCDKELIMIHTAGKYTLTTVCFANHALKKFFCRQVMVFEVHG